MTQRHLISGPAYNGECISLEGLLEMGDHPGYIYVHDHWAMGYGHLDWDPDSHIKDCADFCNIK